MPAVPPAPEPADAGPAVPRRPLATGDPAAADPRAAARASLAAGRSPSLWWVCTGVVVAVAVAWTVGAAEGAVVLAALLAVSGIARAVLPRGPVALTVRSRTMDTGVLLGLAVGLGVLSQLIPSG